MYVDALNNYLDTFLSLYLPTYYLNIPLLRVPGVFFNVRLRYLVIYLQYTIFTFI